MIVPVLAVAAIIPFCTAIALLPPSNTNVTQFYARDSPQSFTVTGYTDDDSYTWPFDSDMFPNGNAGDTKALWFLKNGTQKLMNYISISNTMATYVVLYNGY